jgi:hypothetical protein
VGGKAPHEPQANKITTQDNRAGSVAIVIELSWFSVHVARSVCKQRAKSVASE